MKIRSITSFIDPSHPLDEQKMEKAGEFLRIAQPAFIQAGYEVESARLASVPFSMLLDNHKKMRCLNWLISWNKPQRVKATPIFH